MVRIKNIIFVMAIFVGVNAYATKTKLSLQKAFDKHLIAAKALCTGGLELDYTLTNLSKDSLSILVPAGWRFNSDAGKNNYQDVFITQDQILTLNPKQQKRYHIVGFCCEAHESGPIKDAPYTNGKMGDSSIVLLARYLNAKKIDHNTQQQAVWAISDNEPTANIAGDNDSVAELLRHYVAKLKGEPIPWYTLQKRSRVSAYGDVINKPVKFIAEIPIGVSEVCYSYCFIVDENDQIVSNIVGQWIGPTDGTLKTNFKIADLKNGSYKLVLETKKGDIFGKSFKI